jgi:hypothetical protein
MCGERGAFLIHGRDSLAAALRLTTVTRLLFRHLRFWLASFALRQVLTFPSDPTFAPPHAFELMKVLIAVPLEFHG